MTRYDLIIVGGGASGMLAAINAKKSGIENILLIEKDLELGGALNIANYNISQNGNMSGISYRDKLLKEYKLLNVETYLNTMVLNIDNEKAIVCTSPERGIEKLFAKNIILANGGKDRGRNMITMPGDRCSGILTISMAKKFLRAGNLSLGSEIIIYGTENLEAIEADLLSNNIKVKAIIGEKIPNTNIAEMKYSGFKIKEILGEGRIESIIMTDGSREENLKCDTLILALGMLSDGIVPMRSNIKLNPETTGPEVDKNLETSRENIFACGNGIYIHKDIETIEKEVSQLIEYIE